MRSTPAILMVTAMFIGIGLMVSFSKARSRVTQIPQTISRPPEQRLALQRTVTTQRRFNRYFQQDVTPKLKDCWARIKGRGSVEIQYTYRRDPTGKWITDHLAVNSSTLPRGQEAVALQCMQDSVRSTTLPGESTESTYTLFWNWSVPLPSSFPPTAIQNNPFPDEGGGGCDGKGAPARCWLCGPGGHCQPACFGGEACRSTVRWCRVAGDCGTGGIYGVAGQAMIQ